MIRSEVITSTQCFSSHLLEILSSNEVRFGPHSCRVVFATFLSDTAKIHLSLFLFLSASLSVHSICWGCHGDRYKSVLDVSHKKRGEKSQCTYFHLQPQRHLILSVLFVKKQVTIATLTIQTVSWIICPSCLLIMYGKFRNLNNIFIWSL